MQIQPDTLVEIDGELHEIFFVSDLSDAERVERGYPPKGTKCACDRCACDNEGDAGTIESPICGCCRADCPDAHPET